MVEDKVIPILFFLLIFIPTYPMTKTNTDYLLRAYKEYVKTEQGTDFSKFIGWINAK